MPLAVTKAEIQWRMKVFLKHFSYRTFLNVKDLSQSIFPDTEIAYKFAWSRILYINFRLAQYFKEELLILGNHLSSLFYVIRI